MGLWDPGLPAAAALTFPPPVLDESESLSELSEELEEDELEEEEDDDDELPDELELEDETDSSSSSIAGTFLSFGASSRSGQILSGRGSGVFAL